MAYSSISDLVKELNFDWFQRKTACYQSETFFNKNSGKIYAVLEEYSTGEDDDGNVFPLIEEIVIDVALSDYCWDDEYPHSRSKETQSSEVFPVNGSSIAYHISVYLKTTLQGITSVEVIHKVILSTLDDVRGAIKELLLNINDQDYIEALDIFLIRFRKELFNEYKHIKMSYDISENYVERLAFNLNQEELGALLYILYKADVFEVSAPGDTSFLNYCASHFYFSNQKTGTFTPASKVRGKFNDAKNHATYSARDGVIHKLKEAFKDL